MKQDNTCSTVILLLNGKSKDEINTCREWFKNSRFLTTEAGDIFQALEDIGDYTLRYRPEVVLLEMCPSTEDFLVIQKVVRSSSGQGEIPIMALSDSDKTINHKDCFEGNLKQLEVKLDKVIRKQARLSMSV